MNKNTTFRKKAPEFNYAGYKIPKAYILMLKYKLKYNTYTIDRLIYRAVQYADWLKAEGVEPELIKIMQAGLRKSDDPTRNRWLLRASIPEEVDRGYVQGWIDRYIYGKKVIKKPVAVFEKSLEIIPESISDILKKYLPSFGVPAGTL